MEINPDEIGLSGDEQDHYMYAKSFKYDEPYFSRTSLGGRFCGLANLITRLLDEVNKKDV